MARVQAGEAVEVTSHNRLIARFVGVPAEAAVALRAPIARGALTWTARKPRLQPPLALAE
ncbi:hypothetical protein U5801_18365 [Lamprobacter modestohalophilus]|uniref:hypothetical protein n=1 Tax=Lamprobacter modestohalophilus TaxID=1064514 RepID=UPI002ADEF364|nr:hypothetical protein [Lamprobacter modestohalophilus]MEA1051751.1 hypothetical protein [Lamprobacter modestohalophilus]